MTVKCSKKSVEFAVVLNCVRFLEELLHFLFSVLHFAYGWMYTIDFVVIAASQVCVPGTLMFSHTHKWALFIWYALESNLSDEFTLESPVGSWEVFH